MEDRMEKDTNCAYCMEGELVAKFGIKICELETSKLYLFKEQSHKGRVIVAHKKHVGDMTELSEEERNAYFADIAKVSLALQKAFCPDKINYGAYGDTGHHLHFHLVPKYKEEYEWGGVFAMNPGEKTLTEEEYQSLIEKIKEYL
ncbi:MAG: HIT family protein [Lachnospiraceae bacterium]|nr:HIT family protein [Lachnospiraceae bacterium]